jgi:hypothetical protein
MTERTQAQQLSLLLGIVFLLLGILGFVPGITTNYDALSFAGDDSGAKLLGIFQVSILHNLVHLGYGVVGIALAKTADGSRTFLVGGGILYLALWIYGLVIDLDGSANFVALNTPDNWLHFALGITMLGLGLVLTRGRRRHPAAA